MQLVFRLKKHSYETLMRYGSDINIAISKMGNRIIELERELEKEKSVTESLQKAFSSVSGPFTTFRRASDIGGYQTIGNISEEEKLQSPVGKQGRIIR